MIWKREKKSNLWSFSTIKLRFENHFYDSLTCNSEKGTLADTDKVHSGSSGNRTVSLLLPAKQPLSQPSPSYEKLAGLRQCLIMTGEQKKRSKDDNNAVGAGKKMRKSSRPGNMLRQGAGQATKLI